MGDRGCNMERDWGRCNYLKIEQSWLGGIVVTDGGLLVEAVELPYVSSASSLFHLFCPCPSQSRSLRRERVVSEHQDEISGKSGDGTLRSSSSVGLEAKFWTESAAAWNSAEGMV
jgi:hypothetical protein